MLDDVKLYMEGPDGPDAYKTRLEINVSMNWAPATLAALCKPFGSLERLDVEAATTAMRRAHYGIGALQHLLGEAAEECDHASGLLYDADAREFRIVTPTSGSVLTWKPISWENDGETVVTVAMGITLPRASASHDRSWGWSVGRLGTIMAGLGWYVWGWGFPGPPEVVPVSWAEGRRGLGMELSPEEHDRLEWLVELAVASLPASRRHMAAAYRAENAWDEARARRDHEAAARHLATMRTERAAAYAAALGKRTRAVA